MKSVNLIPAGVLSVLLVFACTDETAHTTIPTQPHAKQKPQGVIVENPANPYDAVGLSYRELLFAYRAGDYSPQNYADLVAVVNGLTNGPLLPATDTQQEVLLATCMHAPDAALSALLQQSLLSQPAKALLTDCILSYERWANLPFSDAVWRRYGQKNW